MSQSVSSFPVLDKKLTSHRQLPLEWTAEPAYRRRAVPHHYHPSSTQPHRRSGAGVKDTRGHLAKEEPTGHWYRRRTTHARPVADLALIVEPPTVRFVPCGFTADGA